MTVRRPNIEKLESRILFHADHRVTVTPTAVITEHDTVPRFAATPNFIAVNDGAWSNPATWNVNRVPDAGAQVQIPTGMDIIYDVHSQVPLDAIEVSGRLDFRTDSHTSLWLHELMVMPEGTLTIGTQSSPIQAGVSAELVFLDGAQTDGLYFKAGTVSAPGMDPSQYGNGLLVFGEVSLHGSPMDETFVRLQTDALAGSSVLELQSDQLQWRVGDTVVIPDTRQVNPVGTPNYYNYRPQWETRQIASVNGNQLTLSTPLTFDHKAPRDADGTQTLGYDGSRLAPHLGNLSRNVVLRSENPNGVRGHTAYFAEAEVDIQFVEFRELGRTAAQELDNTVLNRAGRPTHIGRNQAGRYPIHLHHVDGPEGGINFAGDNYQWIVNGNSVSGSGKWGVALHDTHFGLLSHNVIYDIDGAGVATEDGSEFGNLIEKNFAVRMNGGGGTFDGFGLTSTDRGDLGDGFWFAGPMNIVQNNVVANAYREGYSVWPENTPNTRGSRYYRDVQVPVHPGSTSSRTVNILEVPFDKFFGNEAYGAMTTAVGLWGIGDRTNFPQAEGANTLTNTMVWHVSGAGIVFYYASSYTINGWLQRGDPYMILRGAADGGPSHPSIGAAILFGGADAKWAKVDRADIQNMTYGFVNRGRGLADELDLSNSYFDNHYNILNWPYAQVPADGSRDFRMVNVRFGDAVNPGSSNTIDMQWQPPTEESALVRESLTVRSFEGQPGIDLRVYYAEQAPGVIAHMVPPGESAVSQIAPTRERDGDHGQAATTRAKALGISGLVFDESLNAAPKLFANVELYFGKPTLFYTVLGNKDSVHGVRFDVAGRTFDSQETTGIIDLDFISNRGSYALSGTLLSDGVTSNLSRVLTLPLRTAPGAANSNRRPVLAAIGDKSGIADSTLAFTVAASDPDFDELRFQVSGLPPSAQLDVATGRFTWTPSNNEAGDYVAIFKVTDSKGLSASERVTISIAMNLQDVLVGSWPLNEVDQDSMTPDTSVLGQQGLVHRATRVAPHGLSLNGRDSVITVEPSLAYKPTAALTLSIDAKPIGNRNSFSRLIGIDTGSVAGYELSVKDGGSMRDHKGLLTGYWFTINTATGLHSVSWRSQNWNRQSLDNVVGVFDGDREGGWMAIYVNGILADELSGVGSKIVYPGFGSQKLYLGGRANGNQMLAGILANAKVIADVVLPGLAQAAEGEKTAPLARQDVNGDQTVSPLDALYVIDFLNTYGSTSLNSFSSLQQLTSDESPMDQQWWWLDANRDGVISPMDALEIISEINHPTEVQATDIALGELAAPSIESEYGRKRLRDLV